MTITTKTYEQAAAAGDLFRWFDEALASAERFNLNTQYLTDTIHALDAKTDQTLTSHEGRLTDAEAGLATQATALSAMETVITNGFAQMTQSFTQAAQQLRTT